MVPSLSGESCLYLYRSSGEIGGILRWGPVGFVQRASFARSGDRGRLSSALVFGSRSTLGHATHALYANRPFLRLKSFQWSFVGKEK
ncbi:MAG: hypothetical protein MI923_14035 [Phycisphaerales bacterium]|nr:hypothetical protein [Phycisphaerales bacterium]